VIASLWAPSPVAMKELWKGTPVTVPGTLTTLFVSNYSAEPGITTYVQPPLAGLVTSLARNSVLMVIIVGLVDPAGLSPRTPRNIPSV
jgi:hypothetical protein